MCPLYRYSSIFDHYEVNSGAPAYFHDVTYFLATQANPYNADRKGLGRRSRIINSHTVISMSEPMRWLNLQAQGPYRMMFFYILFRFFYYFFIKFCHFKIFY